MLVEQVCFCSEVHFFFLSQLFTEEMEPLAHPSVVREVFIACASIENL